ncbi:MAG TPA: outer membrane beta-barrel protein [Reyranella sp.]|nr:outer membrane beta-barrel protein [Reyranella sp.]
MTMRSLFVQALVRALLLAVTFVLAFAVDVRAQQSPANMPGDGLLVRFLGNFFNGSQDIAKSPWPYNSGAPSDLRKLPAPQNSPPFPYSEYQIGGTPTIGDRNEMTLYPLTKALQDGPDGKWWKESRIAITGWIELGANGSTSANQPGAGSYGNAPYLYDQQPNAFNLHQADIHAMRLPDTFQTDHVDWGFRVDAMYGQDYRYTTMKGLFSQQLLVNNQHYGYDMPMMYGDIYVPWVAQGMNIRIGRFISLPDIEAQLAPDNYMFSHSLLYGYDPYTQMGIVATVKIDNNWTIQLGLTGGNDTAIWDPDAVLSPLACVQWTASSNGDSVYGCANSINGAQYRYNNVNQLVATWSHRFSQTWNVATEAWYMWEKDVPACSGITNTPGGINLPYGCAPIAGFTQEWAIVNYINLQVTEKDSFSLRNEFINDVNGQRTGIATRYYGIGGSWTHFFKQNVLLRPELVYYQAMDNPAFQQGTKFTQLVAAADLIIRF